MEVDGDSSHPMEPTSSIVFNSVGEHTIKFTLSDPTFIYSYTFAYCSDLTSIEISEGVTLIGDKAFLNCDSLTSATIPESVTEIGGFAFSPNSSLESVTVLATTPPILGYRVFWGNTSGRKIYVPAASLETYKAASGWSDYAADIEAIQ